MSVISIIVACLAISKGAALIAYEIFVMVFGTNNEAMCLDKEWQKWAFSPFSLCSFHESRIRIVEGDFFRDPIPKGHDAIIIANIIHCFPADLAQELLRRVADCVSVGARILLVDFWTNVTHTEPIFAALMAGEFLLTPGRGDVYSVEEAERWFGQIGWRQVEHRPLAGPASLLVAEA